MDGLTAFGLFAVTAMLVCYALEDGTNVACKGVDVPWSVPAPVGGNG